MSFSNSSVIPTLNEWLALSQTEIATWVRTHHLAVMFSIDGSRRHYLLAQPADKRQISDFAVYVHHNALAYVRVYELLLAHGVETILTPTLYPPNFVRNERYLQQSVAMSQQFLCNSPFLEFYQQWQVRARLYGDHAFAPQAAPVRTALTQLETALESLTPTGERQVLFGYNAGTFMDEIIRHTSTLHAELGRVPTQAEVRVACFPVGPEKINLLIGASWLRVGLILPPVLDGGATDIYNLNHLTLDLQESTLRHILYDHLFQRWAGPEDDAEYTPADLNELETYYASHRECLVGTGQLVGPGLWYADHAHRPG